MRKSLAAGAVLAGGLWIARRSYEWSDRGVLIVGGSRGLGLLLARRLGRKGARLVLSARDEGELERARTQLVRKGVDVQVIPADVASEAQATALVDDAAARLGKLDVLINAASIIHVAPLEALSIEDLRAAMDVNFWGTVYTSLAALRHLRKNHGARIVNISSIGGAVAVPHLLPYSCGKFAVTGFSEGLQAEVAREGIRVVTVLPWLMRTGSAPHALVKGHRRAESALFHLAASLPLLTLDAGRAADRIVRAAGRGERFVTLGFLGKTLRIAHALMPGAAGLVLGGAARLLPKAPEGAAAMPPTKAKDHPSAWTRSPLTALGRRAAGHNNEVLPPER